jgi:thiosulfate/3-mercaptopyruvate sulfurtransferase
VRKLGLGDGVRIVVYDGGSMMGASRVWWTFRAFGHEDIAVLDGGLAKWIAEGRPVTDEPTTPQERHFTARQNSFLVRDLEQVRANMKSGREQLLDARGAGRFTAEEPEIRPGLRGGHIPGSANLPYSSLLNGDGTVVATDKLAEAFAKAGVDPEKPIITTCGSGISASFLALALHLLGSKRVSVYDGSWTEWGGRDDTPVETGPARS